MASERYTSCRLCTGQCGLRFEIDDNRVVKVQGDRANPVTRGYACIKGLTLHEAHASPDRILHPMRRRPDGSFEQVTLDDALDDIAARLQSCIARLGPHAVGAFRGTMNYSNTLANALIVEFLRAVGSRSFFSTMTIDQSCHWVTAERMGTWSAGRTPTRDCDVVLICGANPLVSHLGRNFILQDPAKALKQQRARGLKVIVVDPRETETSRHADIHLRPLPGEDATLFAAMLHAVFAQGWTDEEFCRDHADGVARLRTAVEAFAPEHIAARVGVPAADIVAAARLFAAPVDGRPQRGWAYAGTGTAMGPRSNLAAHLVECLNVVCGRFPRAGERVANPGVFTAAVPPRAEVVAPRRGWEQGWKDANGFGMLFGERLSATLPDAIRSRGEDRVACLIVDGGNPVNAIPGSDVAAAFAELELLVSIDPFLNETSRMAHYVIPPLMMLERCDLTSPDYERGVLQQPYGQISMPVLKPPVGSAVVADWKVFHALAQRLGLALKLGGRELDPMLPADDATLLGRIAERGGVPFAEVREATRGRVFPVESPMIEPGRGEARFALAPHDVVSEIAALAGEIEIGQDQAFPFRFSVRRMREVVNTQYHHLPSIARRVPDNPLAMNPDDLAMLGLCSGESVELQSRHGQLTARVVADPTVRRGVVTMTHGWGDRVGANVNRLVHRLHGREPINAMPIMTGFAVRVVRSREQCA